MSQRSPTVVQNATKLVGSAVTLPITLLKYSAGNPVLTGSLLWLLTRAPADLQARALGPLRARGLTNNHISRVVRLLKYLLVIGAASTLNEYLNKLALNYWHLRRPGAPWKFGDATKSELVVVTGGCSGFGYEMVKSFVTKARVIVIDISDLPAEFERNPHIHYYKCDITDFPNLIDICGTIRDTHGNPSVLINNAGIASIQSKQTLPTVRHDEQKLTAELNTPSGSGKTVLDTPSMFFEKIFKVNLISHFVLVKEFLPGMLEQQKGHIVTIASMASFVAAPGLLDYCCTKVGALYFNDGLRAELRDRYSNGHSVCTTVVHPSWHNTGILGGDQNVKKLNEFGIFPDPASRVSDLVVENVLNARSGQIFVPKGEKGNAGTRNWPIWAQDAVSGLMRMRLKAINKNGEAFEFGNEDHIKLRGAET